MVPIMPVGLEQWRASVGSNNAARSHVLPRTTGKRSSKGLLLDQFLSFFVILLTPGADLVTNKGNYAYNGQSLCKDLIM